VSEASSGKRVYEDAECSQAVIMVRTALITGITGQDGSYLQELLLGKGYEVYGLVLKSDMAGVERLANKDDLKLIEGDVRDQSSLEHAVKTSQPDEIYNLAAPTFVASSFKDPILSSEVAGLGALRVMEAARLKAPGAKVFQALTSEMFAGTSSSPQTEQTPFCPKSPYGIAKVFASMSSACYRDEFGIFVGGGIFYNHESPRRPPEFVTRKISLGVARIAEGLQTTIELGNLDAKRDWGYAPEYVDAAWRILQQKSPEDFIIATGELHSVREFLEEACEVAGISDPISRVKVDKRLIRQADFGHLAGDASKARKKLGWKPKTKFKELVRIMVEADLIVAEEEARRKHGR
jgi:GDPmannose 4,6-dehydratase